MPIGRHSNQDLKMRIPEILKSVLLYVARYIELLVKFIFKSTEPNLQNLLEHVRLWPFVPNHDASMQLIEILVSSRGH